jgi:transposase
MLNYEALIQESTEALETHEKRLRRIAVSYRVRMLRLLKSGESRSMARVAEQLGYSMRQYQRWFRSYRQGGLEALLKFEQPRRGERMTQAAREALERAMKTGKAATLEQTRQLLAEQRVPYQSVAGVSSLLIRHKVKLKTGRPRHQQTDEVAQAAFKKLRQRASRLGSKRQEATDIRF